MSFESPHAAERPLVFQNVSSETAPAFGALAVVAVRHENGIAILECTKPSTTFRRHYAANGMQDVPAGQRGACFRSRDARLLYDESSTAETGGAWGPKPSQWALSFGYPGATLRGIAHPTHRLGRFELASISRALVQTTSRVLPGRQTTDYRIFAGTPGSETDAGFTVVPPAHNRTSQPLSPGRWAYLTWTGAGWELEPVETAAYCAVPPCGSGIPARVGDTPGKQECCLFTIADNKLVPVLDGEAPLRVTVHNVRDAAIPPLVPPHETYVLVHPDPTGNWICEPPQTAGTTTTAAPSGPTTTANPNAPPPACSGQCKWEWSIGGNMWTLANNGCSTATTTTSTSTSTTTTPSPLDCLCPTTTTTTGDPTSTTTSTTTSTSTTPEPTTTTTPSPCQCLYPSFCGTEEGECTYTYCVTEQPTSSLDCTTTPDPGQTTTADPEQTTANPGSTTTCDPETIPPEPCHNEPVCGCEYVCTQQGWLLVGPDHDCPGGVVCLPPLEPCGGSNPNHPDDGVHFNCEGAFDHIGGIGSGRGFPPGGLSGEGGCGGSGGGGGGCQNACYAWNPNSGKWDLVCACGWMLCGPCNWPQYLPCRSEPPSQSGSGWGHLVQMPCTNDCDGNGNGFTTTTPGPNPCGPGCKWRGDGGGGWVNIAYECESECTCSRPTSPSHDYCETKITSCHGGTTQPPTTSTTPEPTTTTSTTTTSTTTPDPCWCISDSLVGCFDPYCQAMSGADAANGHAVNFWLCDGVPHETCGECEANCVGSTTTTTTEEPDDWCCCDNDLCLQQSGCGGFCVGNYATQEECQQHCPTTTTTTTCNPEQNCGAANCIFICNVETLQYQVNPGCAAIPQPNNCRCDVPPEIAEMIGLPCSPITPQSLGPCCNDCPGSTNPCTHTTTTTPAP